MGQKLYQQVLSKFVNTHDATFPTLWTKMCSYDCFDVSCKLIHMKKKVGLISSLIYKYSELS